MQKMAARCAEKGVRYEPVVFTTQGAGEPRDEAIISQIAAAIARIEHGDADLLKAVEAQQRKICDTRAMFS